MDPLLSLVAIFTASLGGSIHCVSMCGGLNLCATQNERSLQIPFHLSRLAGYLSLGAIAGLIGNRVLLGLQVIPLQMIAATGMGIMITWSAFRMFQGRPNTHTPWSKFIKPLMRKGFSMKPKTRALWMGFFTAFLPCGWLYTFVLLSMMTGTALSGALTLFAFWLGTLPALVFGSFVIDWISGHFKNRFRQTIATVILVAGVFSTVQHMRAFAATNTSPSNIECHSH